MGRNLPARTLSRNVRVLSVGQDLPAEAQGRQDDMAPVLVLGGEGAVDPFCHLVRAYAGAEVGPLRGGRVSSHHAQGWGHVAGRHQELTSSGTHGRSSFFQQEVVYKINKSSSYLMIKKKKSKREGLL